MAYTNILAVAGMFPTFQRLPQWFPSSAVDVGYVIRDSNGYQEKVTTSGTTGSAQPTWNATQGQTTTDGSVTWANAGQAPIQKPGDSLIQQFIDDISSVITSILLRRFGEAMAATPFSGSLTLWLASLGLANTRWSAEQAFATGAIVIDNNMPPAAQEATTGGTAGVSAPYFSPVYGGTSIDGGITWKNVGQTPQFEVLERGNRYGAASQLGVTLASFGVQGARDLAKEYLEADWQPFLDDLNAARRVRRGASPEPETLGPFDVLFDPLANVSSPRPGLLGIAGGDQDPRQTPYTEGLAAYFGKFGRDYGQFRGGWPDPE